MKIYKKDGNFLVEILKNNNNIYYLYGEDLRNADLRYADLSNADFRNTDLRNADFRNADLSNADLSNADLRYADFRNADLSNADFRNADLSNAGLTIYNNSKWTAYIQKDHTRIGCKYFSNTEWLSFDDEIISSFDYDALKYWGMNKEIIKNIMISLGYKGV